MWCWFHTRLLFNLVLTAFPKCDKIMSWEEPFHMTEHDVIAVYTIMDAWYYVRNGCSCNENDELFKLHVHLTCKSQRQSSLVNFAHHRMLTIILRNMADLFWFYFFPKTFLAFKWVPHTGVHDVCTSYLRFQSDEEGHDNLHLLSDFWFGIIVLGENTQNHSCRQLKKLIKFMSKCESKQ